MSFERDRRPDETSELPLSSDDTASLKKPAERDSDIPCGMCDTTTDGDVTECSQELDDSLCPLEHECFVWSRFDWSKALNTKSLSLDSFDFSDDAELPEMASNESTDSADAAATRYSGSSSRDGLSSRNTEELTIKSSILDNLQHGIAESLKGNPQEPQRDLLITDFSNIEVRTFLQKGESESGPDFKMLTYAPLAFRFFRKLFGVTEEHFCISICETRLWNLTGDSHSGSHLYTSDDDCFVLKTCRKQEADFLLKLLPGYYMNLTQHPKTLLPKFFGLFCYQKGVTRVRILIMNNILPTAMRFHEKYDIKGSTYSKRRTEKKNKKRQEEISGSSKIYKDLDFISRWPDGFYLKEKFYRLLMKSVERDCKVLESYNIMDYSLLVGIHIPSRCRQEISTCYCRNIENTKISNLIGPFIARTNSDADEVQIFLGIIDILQSYNVRKKIEHGFKTLLYANNTISVNRPDFYSKRFQDFLQTYVFKPDVKIRKSTTSHQ